MHRVGALVVLAALPACQLRPGDPIASAAFDAQRGHVLSALDRLDRMPASHVRYKQARELAQALERRIRSSYEKVLEGLALRDEWRDEEAISRFQEALDIWPDVRGAHGLIRATEHRIATLGADRPADWQRVAGLGTPEVGVITTETFDGQSPRPLAEVPSPRRAPETAHRRRLRRDAVTCIRHGDMARATRILTALLRETPDDAPLQAQLARVHYQRGLLAYGQGRLVQAIAAWEQVLRLTPDDAQAKKYLLAVREEAAAQKR